MLHVLSVFLLPSICCNMEYKTMEYCFFISSPRSYQINQNHLLFDTTLLNAHNFLAHISFSDFRCFLALAFYVSSLSLSLILYLSFFFSFSFNLLSCSIYILKCYSLPLLLFSLLLSTFLFFSVLGLPAYFCRPRLNLSSLISLVSNWYSQQLPTIFLPHLYI